MPFDTFKRKVEIYCNCIGISALRIEHVDGRHEALLSNGDFITGNSYSKSVTFRDEYRNHCVMYS